MKVNCCINCFNDPVLKKHINTNGKIDNCNYCNSKNVKTINEIELFDLFYNVIDLYTKNDGLFDEFNHMKKNIPEPKSLICLIQRDYNLFNEERLTLDNIANFLQNISSKTSRLQAYSFEILEDKWYRCSEIYFGYFTNDDWVIFCNNIKHKFRFHYNCLDENNFESDDVFNVKVFEYAKGIIYKDTILYRAREGYVEDKQKNHIQPFSIKKMGIPNNSIITNGRANPYGINYLYTSDLVPTVLAEIRAWNSSINSVAEIVVKKDLIVVDLTEIYETKSPFEWKIYGLFKDTEIINILKAFAFDLSKPINPNSSTIDYIPTQYICEMIKMYGFDGVKFKSSLGKGNNIVLFNSHKIKIKDVKLYRVNDINYDVDEYKY